MKLLNHYKNFFSVGKKYNAKLKKRYYILYLFLRVKYRVGIEDFFKNKLYDGNSHAEYYLSLHFVIHKWKNVKEKFEPNKSKAWEVLHYIDYLISKIICPGLDAMDYYRYEFYNLTWKKRKNFITEGQVLKLNNFFNGSPESKKIINKFKNKDEFNLLFSKYIGRKWIKSFGVKKEEIEKFCEDLKKVIIKPLDGGGGKGIKIININSKEDVDNLFLTISDKNYLIEEVVKQHKILSDLNPSSVNTIRVYSLVVDSDVKITGATLRVGHGLEPVDNYSSGGFAAEIDINSGIVVTRAVTQYGESVYVHPLTRKNIIGVEIPNWVKIKKIVKEAHMLVQEVRYIGWDVVVCEDGVISFLEANTCAGVELQQHPSLIGKKNIYFKYIKTNNDKKGGIE